MGIKNILILLFVFNVKLRYSLTDASSKLTISADSFLANISYSINQSEHLVNDKIGDMNIQLTNITPFKSDTKKVNSNKFDANTTSEIGVIKVIKKGNCNDCGVSKQKRDAIFLTSQNNIVVQGDFHATKFVTLNFPLKMIPEKDVESNSEKKIVLEAQFLPVATSNGVEVGKEKLLPLKSMSEDKVLYLKSISEEIQPLLKEWARRLGHQEVKITHISGGKKLTCPGTCEFRDMSGKCLLDLKCLKDFYKNKGKRAL